jgi:hypothetical protein
MIAILSEQVQSCKPHELDEPMLDLAIMSLIKPKNSSSGGLASTPTKPVFGELSSKASLLEETDLQIVKKEEI